MKNKMLKILGMLFVLGLVIVIIYVSFFNEKTVIINPNPRSENSWVGDVMPFHDGKQWQIFYLEDHRDGNIGFHPFSLLSTSDFVNFEDKGEVLPYVNEVKSQERALGTGSIIKGPNGLYHAFYTAHNGTLEPKEAIMHATSKNLKNWTKQYDDTFFGETHYQRNDFRDPFVLFNEEEQEYWMLITTRKNNMGVIAKYTSTDLKTWKDEGVFFENDMGTDGNLECPSLVYYNGKWYLSFSDQWPDRVTHYRVADSLNGKFEKPTNIDHWDSNGFYAGQIQKDNNDNLYVFAWIPTKEDHSDNKPYNWAGNLAIHQLHQMENGDLSANIPSSVKTHLESKNNLTIIDNGDDNIVFKQNDDMSILKSTIKYSQDAKFGFTFNYQNEQSSQLNVIIQDGKIEFHNNDLKYVDQSKAISTLPINNFNGDMDLKIMINHDIFIFYINEEQAFSTRMIRASGKDFKFFIKMGEVDFKIN